MAKRKQAAKEDVSRISFRLLDDGVAGELARRAQAVGKSRHDFARDLVTAGLSDGERGDAHVPVDGLLDDIRGLRSELRAIRDLPNEAVRDLAEEIDNGLGAEVRELRSALIKLTAQTSLVGDEAGIEQVLDELEELKKSNLDGSRPAAKLLDMLRGDLATSVSILLVHAGKLNREEARKWVQETLVREP